MGIAINLLVLIGQLWAWKMPKVGVGLLETQVISSQQSLVTGSEPKAILYGAEFSARKLTSDLSQIVCVD